MDLGKQLKTHENKWDSSLEAFLRTKKTIKDDMIVYLPFSQFLNHFHPHCSFFFFFLSQTFYSILTLDLQWSCGDSTEFVKTTSNFLYWLYVNIDMIHVSQLINHYGYIIKIYILFRYPKFFSNVLSVLKNLIQDIMFTFRLHFYLSSSWLWQVLRPSLFPQARS